jgi:hypothetical protein
MSASEADLTLLHTATLAVTVTNPRPGKGLSAISSYGLKQLIFDALQPKAQSELLKGSDSIRLVTTTSNRAQYLLEFRGAIPAGLLESLSTTHLVAGPERLPCSCEAAISHSAVTLEALRVAWCRHFFYCAFDPASISRLFRAAAPGRRPDTLVIRDLPLRWFGVELPSTPSHLPPQTTSLPADTLFMKLLGRHSIATSCAVAVRPGSFSTLCQSCIELSVGSQTSPSSGSALGLSSLPQLSFDAVVMFTDYVSFEAAVKLFLDGCALLSSTATFVCR